MPISILTPSNAEVVTELALAPDPTQVIAGEGRQAFIEQMMMEHQPQRSKECTFLVQPFSYEVLERTIKNVAMQAVPTLYFRMGVKTNAGIAWRPWERQLLLSYVAMWPRSGDVAAAPIMRLDTRDALEILNQETKVTPRNGNISQIIDAICTENQIELSIIEQTLTNGKWIQSYQTDYEFIVSRMIPRAVNQQGSGDYRLFVQDNVLHFHTPNYTANTVHQIHFYNNVGISDLKVVDRLQALRGQDGVNEITFDPERGKAEIISSREDLTLRYAKVMPQLNKNALNLRGHIGQNKLDERAIAQSVYDSARHAFYEASFTFDRAPFVSLNDAVELVLYPVQTPSAWSGLYTIAGVRHHLDRGTLISRFTLSRGELESQAQNFGGLPEAVQGKREERVAQGIPFVPGTVASTPRTAGASEVTPNGATIVTVQEE